MQTEDADPQSPLYRIVDTTTLGLAGHSFGGVVGLFASAVDACVGPPIPPFCDDQYQRPRALRAAAFYGTNLVQNGFSLNFNTTGVATALLQGTLDGRSLPRDAALTYPTLEQPRALITIDGANHYGISDENNPPGAIPDPNPTNAGPGGSDSPRGALDRLMASRQTEKRSDRQVLALHTRRVA